MSDTPAYGETDSIADRIKWSIERFGDLDPEVLRTLARELDQLIQTHTAPRDVALAYTVALLGNIREKVEAASRNMHGLTLREWMNEADMDVPPDALIRPLARIREAWQRGEDPKGWRDELMVRDWIKQGEKNDE